MLTFILLSLSFIGGMALAVMANIATSGLALLLTAVFFTCAVIPFWFKHGLSIASGNYSAIAGDDEPVPAMTLIFLMLACAAFGVFRYSSELQSDFKGHFQTICERYDEATTWRIKGKIIEEPSLKGDFLEVIIKPESMRRVVRKRVHTSGSEGARKDRRKGGFENVIETSEAETVTHGLLMAQVFEETEAFREVSFNQTVEVEGQLSAASERRNPGALDYRQYLRNRGIFRSMRITRSRGALKVIEQTESGAIWYRFALHVKNEVLKVIKQTMPYPESSFLGGVLLGLKGGLPPKISQEFRMTGVSHVLAVSGLHVTIIAALLYGVFSMLRVPLRVFAPIVVFSLFTFAMIVGWPSSAVRAALMNSLFILSRAYLKDYGFKLSVLFSLCVASDFILFMSPLQLTEPSFVLSVMAIYALAVFSEPSGEILRKMLRGPGLFFAASATAVFFLAIVIRKDLVLLPYFFPGVFVYIVATCLISNRLANMSSFQSFAFEMLPGWLQSFLGAQIAIFIAMMGPLSAFYFGQLSLAAPIANLIAIPLIGVIVQIGLIAGLTGAFIPLVGLPIALVLNAANWLAVKFFLGMATFFAVLIPFPRISQPSFAELVVYYLVLHLFFFRKEILTWASAIYSAAAELYEDPDYRTSMSGLAIVVVTLIVAGSVIFFSGFERKPDMRLTMLDVGFGSSLMLESGGKISLFDAGLNDTLAGVDRGERVIQPALSGKQAREVEAVFLTSALPERISGLRSVLGNYRVKRIYAPFDIPDNGRKITFDEYARNFSLGDLKLEKRIKGGQSIAFPPGYYWELAFNSYNHLIEDIFRYKIQVSRIAAGDKITDLGPVIEVLHPGKTSDQFKNYYDGALISISSGDKSYLFLSGNAHPLQDITGLRPQFIFSADLPFPADVFEQFVKSTRPEGVAVSFRFPSQWLIEDYHMAGTISSRHRSYSQKFRQWPVPVYLTSENGAVQVDQTRGSVQIKPFIREK